MNHLIQVAGNIGRWIFGGSPPDNLKISGNKITYVAEGKKGYLCVEMMRHISLEDSFLGLFGCTLKVTMLNGPVTRIKGLNKERAVRIKEELQEAQASYQIDKRIKDLTNSMDQLKVASEGLSKDGFFSAVQMNQWLEEFSELKFLASLPNEKLQPLGDGVLHCKDAFADPESWRSHRNGWWMANEYKRREEFFVGYRKEHGGLSPQQIEVILKHDNAVLAVAGAGTGKTTTVIGKVAYLLDSGACKPEEILLLSFSKAAVEELQMRINTDIREPVEAKTFHAFGLDIITEASGRKPAISDSQDFLQAIEQSLSEIMIAGGDGFRNLTQFLTVDFYPPQQAEEFATKRECLEYVSNLDLETIKGEKVRSHQEAQIADWLFLNGIKYVYEAEYRETKTGSRLRRIYKPDFYLPDYGIYIEHWGVKRSGSTAPWIDGNKYKADMTWKRQLHASNGSVLFETYSYQHQEGTLFKDMLYGLQNLGVKLCPLTPEKILRYENAKIRIKRIAQLIATCINLFKGDKVTLEEIESILVTSKSTRRDKVFFKLFKSTLDKYEETLKIKGAVDFGDMITEAAKQVVINRYKSPYKVVIVDEFQDISVGRSWLVNAIVQQVEDCRLLCVGDDWQSIYRFAGSDVGIMTNFENSWSNAVRVDLNRTFRFNEKINEVSSIFITQNPAQLKKSITCSEKRESPAVHVTALSFEEVIKEIGKRDGLPVDSPWKDPCSGSNILVLGRYNHSSPKGLPASWNDANWIPSNGKVRRKGFMTIHKSKGLEADYVILNGMASGKYGFPSEMTDDPLLRHFLPSREIYKNAEERRLFYVALTRAKKEVWLLVDAKSANSTFIQELTGNVAYSGLISKVGNLTETKHLCPECDSSMILRTNGSDQKFLGCIHYPRCSGLREGCPECGDAIPVREGNSYRCEKCDWVAGACPECSAGFLTHRKGKNGSFMGCSRYQHHHGPYLPKPLVKYSKKKNPRRYVS